jgi:hypothetical protein
MFDSSPGLTIDTTGGPVTFPRPVPAVIPDTLPPADQTPARNNGNTVVFVGAAAIVLMILAYVGLRSHGE